MDLFDWASITNPESNQYVKTLAGKFPNDSVTEEDLEIAKRIIETYFVVGLMTEMEENKTV